MKQTYTITGMTCNGCVSSVKKQLGHLVEVIRIEVHLEKGLAVVSSKEPVQIAILQNALSEKFTIQEQQSAGAIKNSLLKEQHKIAQLKPLFLILFYITTATILFHYKNWNYKEAMLDFMGLFYMVFSFFKMLDLKGFSQSFSMYDPVAKQLPFYGVLYPFIETVLGLLFLLRFQIDVALVATLVVLGITTIGVTKALLDKKTIQCACLGTALKLPMTLATFIENAIMIVMALWMLI